MTEARADLGFDRGYSRGRQAAKYGVSAGLLVFGDPMWYATHMLPVYSITVGIFAYGAWGIWIREKPRQEIEAGL